MSGIRTKRLTIRPFTTDDDDQVLTILNDFEVSKWLHRVPHPFTRADLATTGPDGESRWPDLAAIEHEGSLVGGISTVSHLGYWIAPAHQGKGFATEAARAMVDYTFGTLEQPQLDSGYFLGNDRSGHILRNLGFEEQATSPQLCKARNVELPSVDMLLTRENWLAGHGLPLQGTRVFLRPLSPEDAPALQRIAGIAEIASMLSSVKAPWPDSAVADWIAQSRFRGGLGFRLGICHRATGDLIGVAGVGGQPASMMYFIEKRLWGMGLATEACRLLLRHVFARYPVTEITADCFADNPASARVLEKLGFARVGTDMGNSAARLDPHPVILYRLRRDDTEGHPL